MNLLAAAYIRGYDMRTNRLKLPEQLLSKPLSELDDNEINYLISVGKNNDLKTHYFKVRDELPRVQAVLGFLRSVIPESLLDVGSGRGVFLFPFMSEFTGVSVAALDILPYRVELLNDIHNGGTANLRAYNENICTWNEISGSFDIVTLLEVLEHIPEAEKAVENAVRLARRYVVVSVPSHADSNPEHIHLFTKEKLTAMFNAVGCTKLKFSGVSGHLLMIASVNKQLTGDT